MDIQIRRLHETDIDELRGFFRTVIIDTFEKNNAIYHEADVEDDLRTKERYLVQDVKSIGRERLFLLAVHNDRIVGIAGLYRANEFAIKMTKGAVDGMMELGSIYVAPEYQHKGVGSLLVKAMILLLKSRNVERFCLDSGFGTAQQIWLHKFGKPTYLFEHYWGKDAHHMIWDIDTKPLQVSYHL